MGVVVPSGSLAQADEEPPTRPTTCANLPLEPIRRTGDRGRAPHGSAASLANELKGLEGHGLWRLDTPVRERSAGGGSQHVDPGGVGVAASGTHGGAVARPQPGDRGARRISARVDRPSDPAAGGVGRCRWWPAVGRPKSQ